MKWKKIWWAIVTQYFPTEKPVLLMLMSEDLPKVMILAREIIRFDQLTGRFDLTPPFLHPPLSQPIPK
jgi:hypothetical protein